jgi:CubicO group peptidase (beta-lactamase class C family)
MSHTSGINIAHFSGYSKDAPDTETVLSEKTPAKTPQVKVQGLPGYALSYSGGGIIVLQIILETMTGKNFPTLAKELVLDPLGMSRSFLYFARRRQKCCDGISYGIHSM